MACSQGPWNGPWLSIRGIPKLEFDPLSTLPRKLFPPLPLSSENAGAIVSSPTRLARAVYLAGFGTNSHPARNHANSPGFWDVWICGEQPVKGDHPRLTACIQKTWPIIQHSAQTDPRRFFLPFDHHLRKITEAPISACAPPDGIRRNAVAFRLVTRPMGSRVRCERPRPGHGIDPR